MSTTYVCTTYIQHMYMNSYWKRENAKWYMRMHFLRIFLWVTSKDVIYDQNITRRRMVYCTILCTLCFWCSLLIHDVLCVFILFMSMTTWTLWELVWALWGMGCSIVIINRTWNRWKHIRIIRRVGMPSYI